MDILFGWVMHLDGGGFVPEICSLEGEIVHELPKQLCSDKARKALREWDKDHPGVKLIMMPGDESRKPITRKCQKR